MLNLLIKSSVCAQPVNMPISVSVTKLPGSAINQQKGELFGVFVQLLKTDGKLSTMVETGGCMLSSMPTRRNTKMTPDGARKQPPR